VSATHLLIGQHTTIKAALGTQRAVQGIARVPCMVMQEDSVLLDATVATLLQLQELPTAWQHSTWDNRFHRMQAASPLHCAGRLGSLGPPEW
jgi:hypothetical protein